MTNLQWIDKSVFHETAFNLVRRTSVVLDIGCGIRPQQIVVPDVLICIEPHREYVEILKKNLRTTNTIIIHAEARAALSAFPDKSVDSVFLIDVIEHLPKDAGRQLLSACERVARQQIFLFTPLGFMEQHGGSTDAWNLHGGELQTHRSGWYPEDFPGWTLIACRSLHSHGAGSIPVYKDSAGRPVAVPYGGLYAIKDIPARNDLFNPVYSEDVLTGCADQLSFVRELFPEFVSRYIEREVNASELKCGIRACQFTTELFMSSGATTSEEKILETVAEERSRIAMNEALVFRERIARLAAEFAAINEKQTTLNRREHELKVWEENLKRREGELNRATT